MENTKRNYIYGILGALFVVTLIVAIYQSSRVNAMKISVENNYNRAFHELVDYMDDVDTLLKKSQIVSSSAQISTISSELFRETTAAKACLGQLPISQVQMENIDKFLSQVGDYTYNLSQKSIYQEDITADDYNNLADLSNYASKLKEELLSMQEDIYSGEISFGKIKKEAENHLVDIAKAENKNVLSGFEEMEKQFQEYPSLIYDGPFSEHIEKINPVMTENARSVSEDEALNKLKKTINGYSGEITFDSISDNTKLSSYLFKGATEEKSIYAAITRKGGYPLYFLINREIGEEKISVDMAISKARDFLSNNGFSSIKTSYYDKSGGVVTVNFAYQQGDVTCYSDLIKVKVALDNGEIIGLETKGYLTTHQQRNIDAPTITEEEAKNKISKHLDVESSGLALIPKDSKREVLCYEIKGKHNDSNFLVYINAYNGREEQVLMLIESETGILTV